MAFDFKKEFKEFYMPSEKPSLVEVPKMNFIAVRGQGNPNEEDGEYQKALEKLYPVAYALKMSYKGTYKIEGFFEYVVPPLEGLWWQRGLQGFDPSQKDKFIWISMIRIPDFVKQQDFGWAIRQASKKKEMDFSDVMFFTYDEGLCVQAKHIGPFDDEPRTVKLMEEYMEHEGYEVDINKERHHHEIYLSDFRKTAPEKLKTIIRTPVKKIESI